MRVLDLFSGIGGFSLGLERAGMRTVAFCEIDPFCRQVLRKHWPDTPIHEDIRELDADGFRGSVDLICGGYPCQPFSQAGKRLGTEDDRHLWPEMRRLIEGIRPAWVIGENVYGHISMGLDEVLSDLEALGYAARPFVVPACAVDAPHRRDRIWIVGNTPSERRRETRCDSERSPQRPAGTSAVADTLCRRDRNSKALNQSALDKEWDAAARREGRAAVSGEAWRNGPLADANAVNAQGIGQIGDDPQGRQEPGAGPPRLRNGAWRNREWPPESGIRRVAHGVPDRAHRLRALGNAVVPQVVEMIGTAIMAQATGADWREALEARKGA